jgi:acyl dehydratase
MPGKWFDELEVGQIFEHAIRRTITEADNVWFCAITHNPSRLHIDEEYCRTSTEFGGRILNSAFTLALMAGIAGHETVMGTSVANLGWDEVRFPKPVFHGDTLRVETEVLELRASKSRPDQGIVVWAHRAYNQRAELVAHCKRAGLQRRKPAAD